MSAAKRKTHIHNDKLRYMVTDHILGVINNVKIEANRGDVVYLTEDQHRVFKQKVLLIPREE